MVLAAGILGTAAYVYFKDYSGSRVFVWASILIPIPAGIAVGLWWPGRHLAAYVGMGLLLGITDLVGVVWKVRHLGADWVPVFLVYIVGGAVLFVSGGAFGDWIEQRRMQHPVPSRLASRLAARLVPAGSSAPAVRDAQAKWLAQVISAFAPVLTFAATIITAWLSYLAKR